MDLGTQLNAAYHGVNMKLALAILAVGAMTPATPIEKTKVSLNESLRFESRTTGDSSGSSSWTQTDEAWRSKLTITAEFPIVAADLNKDTEVELKVGKFSFLGKLGDDKSYGPKSTSAKLLQTAESGGSTRAVTSRVELKWTKDKLTAKVIGDAGGVTSAVAYDFRESQIGKIEGVTTALVRVGDAQATFDLPIRGSVARRSASGPGVYGSVTTVNLKGEVTTQ